MILLPLGIVVGSVAGFGKFAHNSGSFTLLLIIVHWWSFYLLPTLGHRVLSIILAPPWSNTADGTAYCGKYQVLEFPRHHQRCGLLATYPTHLSYFWHTDPVHLINAVVRGRPNDSVASLHHELNQHLSPSSHSHWPLALTCAHFPSKAIFLQAILLFLFDIGVQHLIEVHLIVMAVNPLFSVGQSLFKMTLCHGSTMSACPPHLLKPSSKIMTPVGLWIFIQCSLTTASLRLLNMTPSAFPTLIVLLIAINHIHLT
jgi:hypothetical protein